jgi:hypothetical protein
LVVFLHIFEADLQGATIGIGQMGGGVQVLDLTIFGEFLEEI